MSRTDRKRATGNAGAFYSPDGFGMIAVPMRPLGNDYGDEPTELEDDREPEPEPPGLIRRVVERLTHQPGPDR
jgi:hypothetical protein